MKSLSGFDLFIKKSSKPKPAINDFTDEIFNPRSSAIFTLMVIQYSPETSRESDIKTFVDLQISMR